MRGQAAEELVEWAFRRLRERGLVFVVRVTPPAKIVRRGGAPVAYVQRAGLPDFIGFLPPHGRGVLFDVKSTREASWSWEEGRGRAARTKAHQVADLMEAGRHGVLAGLLLCFWGTRPGWPTWVWLSWPLLPQVAVGAWRLSALDVLPGAVLWEQTSSTPDEAFLVPIRRQDAMPPMAVATPGR